MGAHLSSPKTEKQSSSGGDLRVTTTQFGSSSMQGWRISMEDAHLAIPDFLTHEKYKIALYGVFDGHGGNCVSHWAADNFPELLKDELYRFRERATSGSIQLKSQDSIGTDQAIIAESLQSAFLRVDEELMKPETDAVLQSINERLRTDPADIPNIQDGANLFKVLLPDRLPNRQHTIQLIEQHTERAFRESMAETFCQEGSRNGVLGHEREDGVSGRVDDQEIVMLDVDSGSQVQRNGEVLVSRVPEGSIIGNLDENKMEGSFQSTTCGVYEEVDEEDLNGMEIESEAVCDFSHDQGDEGSLAYGCGAASVVVAVIGGETPSLLIANAGDSRAVLCRDGKAIPLSHDHKPQLPEEGERIRRAGGSVTNGRVDGNLNLSRSIGDLAFKRDTTLSPAEQKISAFPDVRICPLIPNDEFVILACDGIWDCKTNQQAVDFVHERLDRCGRADPEDLARICEELCDACLSNNPSESEGIGCDNMTCIIVQLGNGLFSNAKGARFSDFVEPKITLYGKKGDLYLSGKNYDSLN